MGPRLRVATNNVNWVGNMPLGFMISSYSCVTALEALRKLNTVQVCPISRHCLRPHLVFCFAILRVYTLYAALSMLSCRKTRKVKPTLNRQTPRTRRCKGHHHRRQPAHEAATPDKKSVSAIAPCVAIHRPGHPPHHRNSVPDMRHIVAFL